MIKQKRKFKTQDNFWQKILRFILGIFWEPFSIKKSHWWDWTIYSKEIVLERFVLGNSDAKTRNTFCSNLWQTNFGWKKCIIVSAPQNFKSRVNTYQVGFIPETEGIKLCSLIFERDQRLAMLVGKDDFKIFAVANDGRNIRLNILKQTNKFMLQEGVVLI